MEENPQRYLAYLQQCLASDKRPLGVFLGAGCPLSIRVDEDKALIPDIAGITELVRSSIQEGSCAESLAAVERHFSDDGREGISMEDVLTHIRSLRAVAGNASVRGLTASDLDQLDDAICTEIHRIVSKELPGVDTAYHNLVRWVDVIAREHAVQLFTTNYDLLLEQALEEFRVPFFDGFAGVRTPFFDLRAIEEDTLPSRWARVWKLHGSINWYIWPNRGVFRGDPTGKEGIRRVIHPSHLKYEESRRMPYLAMLDRLRAFLRQSTATLIIVGYSFRDQHLNEVVLQGLRSTPSATAFALLFGDRDSYPEAVHLAKARPNLTLLARDGAVVGGAKLNWAKFRDGEFEPEPTVGMRLTPVSGDADDVRSEFTLGDFRELGAFFQLVVGGGARSVEMDYA